jgi:flagellar biosynthesis/type III secretory pathway protein FliH
MKNSVRVLHLDESIMFIGTESECVSFRAKQQFDASYWEIHTVEEYGEHCYDSAKESGYNSAYNSGYDDGYASGYNDANY